MSIEVTDEDVREFEKLSGFEAGDWHPAFTKKIIAASYEVMKRKHGDTLAEAVKEAAHMGIYGNGVITFKGNNDSVIVDVSSRGRGRSACRTISLDNNFPALAAAAVRDLSRQVRQ